MSHRWERSTSSERKARFARSKRIKNAAKGAVMAPAEGKHLHGYFDAGRYGADSEGVADLIDWVSHLLEAWGRWENRRVSGGLGWPSSYPGYSESVGVVSAENTPLPTDFNGADYARISTAVQRLPDDSRRLATIVVYRYVRGQQYRTIAGHLLRPVQTVRDHMHAAHVILAREIVR